MHTLPWHVPVPQRDARLTSSMCWKPLPHTISKSSTVTFEHGHTVPVVDAAFDAGHRFFALSQKDKERRHIDGWPLKRGFDPIGWQALDPGQIGPAPGAFVVNVGDMMQCWTNDRWPSTMHRVINQISGRDRWSIAYFFDLDAESRIEPLASCVTATRPPRYAPITAGEHLIEMYRKTTVAA